MNDEKLIKKLVDRKMIAEDDVKGLKEELVNSKKPLKELLLKKGIVNEEQYKLVLSEIEGFVDLDLSSQIIDPEVLTLLPETLSRKYNCIPIFMEDGVLSIAMADPHDIYIIDAIKQKTNCELNIFKASQLDIERAIDQHYGTSGTLQDVISGIDEERFKKGDEAESNSIVTITDLMIVQALKERASDIHIEPEYTYCRIRFRIDGILYTKYVIPKFLQPALVSRIKVASLMDISEHRIPQDGRIQMKIGEKEIDIRVSVQPTFFGENIVMRILDKSSIAKITFDKLGFQDKTLEVVKEVIERPHGVLLVTGPTGSGKTTTLYTFLKTINREGVNIMTMEDPIEYQFEMMRQTQVNPQIGLTFASGLRAVLRQDPDIILVGEIRDLETARISVQCALTGHYVFSTLHTNDAASSFTRLTDMGIEPFLTSSCIVAVIAQRLARTICPKCKEKTTYPDNILKKLKLSERGLSDKAVFYRGKGCNNCGNLGYRGRVGIYELLIMSPAIHDLIIANATALEIKKQAIKEGMHTLFDDCLDKVLNGETTVEELFRVALSEMV